MARKDKYIQFAGGLLTLSAANTLTELEIQTNLSLMGGQAWEIHEVECQIGSTDLIAVGDALQFALSGRQGEAAIPTLEDTQFIYGRDVVAGFVTSGLAYLERYQVRKFTKPIILLTDKISAYGLSAGQAAALTMHFRISYTVVAVKGLAALEVAETWR